MREATITGLDVGSTTIRAVVGEVVRNGDESSLQIIGFSEFRSEGITRGSVVSLEDAASSISACIEHAEKSIGIPVESAWVGISGPHIMSQSSRGVVAVGKVNGEISRQDVERAIEAARTIATPPNFDLLHIIPRHSVIDGRADIKDPIGMVGMKLEVDTHIIQGYSSHVKNFTKCIYRTGLEIDDLVFSALATAEAVLTGRQKELGAVLVIIGGATTSLVIYEGGDILHSAVLPIGSDHITSDIAIGLRIGLDLAEKIKLEFGTLFTKELNKKAEIDFAELDPIEHGSVSHRYIAEIVEARVEEIFDKVELELKKVGRYGMLPAGVILSGGGSKLPGMVEFAKRRLKLPASYAVIKGSILPHELLSDQSYMTALGLLSWGFQSHNQKTGRNNPFSGMQAPFDLQDRVKKWLKSLLP